MKFQCGGCICCHRTAAAGPLFLPHGKKKEETLNHKNDVQYACRFMMVASSAYCLLTLVNTVRFTIQGMGFSVIAVLAGVMEMCARTIAGLILAPAIGFMGICMAHPLAWIFADLFLIPCYFLCRRHLQKDRKLSPDFLYDSLNP